MELDKWRIMHQTGYKYGYRIVNFIREEIVKLLLSREPQASGIRGDHGKGGGGFTFDDHARNGTKEETSNQHENFRNINFRYQMAGDISTLLTPSTLSCFMLTSL